MTRRASPKTILITGASSGIGRALAIEYGRRGAHVAVSARREAELVALCQEIRAAGGRADLLVCDVADAHAAHALARRAEEALGSLDMVIANAGVGTPTHASRLTLEGVVRTVDVNVRGAMATLVGAIPTMLAQQRGHLVGVSSLAGRRALPGTADYNASKAALSVFLEGLAIDLEPAGISVTDVQPGFVDTAMTRQNDFRMPFLWDAEEAARYVVDRLDRASHMIAFPLPLRLLTRLSQLLPLPVYAAITRAAAPRSHRGVLK
jgi:NAD(P)-dependent dehydrogenase (short-subunit alcohol dehydrogenase family)